jgi:tetratricopeptide (TPR) repeat protein
MNFQFKQIIFILLVFFSSAVRSEEADLGESQSGLEKETWEHALHARGTFEEAARLQEYLKLFPHGAHAACAYLSRGFKQENQMEARQDFQAALAADPKGPWAAGAGLELGKLEYSLGQYPEARAALDTALDLSSTPSAEARFWRGQARLMSRDFKGSLEDFNALVKTAGASDLKPLAALGQADCLAALSDTPAAIQAYASLCAGEGPVRAQALWQAASLEERLGRKEEAHQKLVLLADGYPESFEGQRALARLKAEPPPLAVKEGAKREGFCVQVGSYASGAWADKLVKALKKKKYPVSKNVVRTGGHLFHEVRVGRWNTRAEALAAGKKIARKEGLPFMVKPLE